MAEAPKKKKLPSDFGRYARSNVKRLEQKGVGRGQAIKRTAKVKAKVQAQKAKGKTTKEAREKVNPGNRRIRLDDPRPGRPPPIMPLPGGKPPTRPPRLPPGGDGERPPRGDFGKPGPVRPPGFPTRPVPPGSMPPGPGKPGKKKPLPPIGGITPPPSGGQRPPRPGGGVTPLPRPGYRPPPSGGGQMYPARSSPGLPSSMNRSQKPR